MWIWCCWKLKNNHHRDKNYHRDQSIMGHIICTMVLDCRKNGGRIDWLSWHWIHRLYRILTDQLSCLWLLFPSSNQVCHVRLSCGEVAYCSRPSLVCKCVIAFLIVVVRSSWSHELLGLVASLYNRWGTGGRLEHGVFARVLFDWFWSTFWQK
jgi:hypothetical protein